MLCQMRLHYFRLVYVGIAQLVEFATDNRKVGGSRPPTDTKISI